MSVSNDVLMLIVRLFGANELRVRMSITLLAFKACLSGGLVSPNILFRCHQPRNLQSSEATLSWIFSFLFAMHVINTRLLIEQTSL